MDLVGACTSCQQSSLMSQIQFAAAKKLMSTQLSQGEALIKLIEAAGKTAGQGSDELAAAAIGLGATLDVKA